MCTGNRRIRFKGHTSQDGVNKIIINKKKKKELVINSYHYKINVPFKIYNYIYINIMFCVNSSTMKKVTKESFGLFQNL